MKLEMENNIYYHITSIKKLNVGEIIQFGYEYNNFYNEMFNIKHCNSNNKDANEIMLDLFNNKSLTFNSINDFNTVFSTINDNAFVLREIVFEKIRELYYPNLPSRLKCMYVLKTTEEVEIWLNIFKRIKRKPLQIVKLELNGNIFVSNAGLILRKNNSISDKITEAKAYCSSDKTDFIPEYLFSGIATVIEVKSIDE